MIFFTHSERFMSKLDTSTLNLRLSISVGVLIMKTGVIFISMLLISGCYYDIAEELYPNNNVSCDTSPDIYNPKIKGLLASSCAISGCHITGGQGPDLSDSTVVYDKIDRIKVRAIDLKDMPKSGPLSACDVKTLQRWIDGGTK